MNMADYLVVREGICEFRPRGDSSLVETVELITRAIAYCRDRRIDKLLVVTTGLVGVSIPTLIDRFLMIEEWAGVAKGMVVGALVASPEYIHPEKFGVRVAADLGWVADVFTSEADALKWLSNYRLPG
jgi:hypothetical protein